MRQFTLGGFLGFSGFFGVFGGLLLACSIALAQVAPPPRTSFAEPPVADPGEFKPAPSETVVVPGQPRPFPAVESTPAAPAGGAEQPTGIQPAQYLNQPKASPQPAAPAVLYPEPPTPSVKISVKGLDIAATGQDLTYRLTVSNTSEARAHNVIARCPVPRGAKAVKTLPEAKGDDKELEWHLETLEPGASRQIEVVFKPSPDASEIAVIGKVQFEHGRVIKTKLANPTLEMRKTGPAQGILHEPLKYKIVLTNPGKVPVTEIQIVDTLPEGLEYVQETSNDAIAVSRVGPKPNQRTWTLPVMRPKETRTIEYRVMPGKLGDWTSDAVATATGVHEKAGFNTVIHEAKIILQVEGPEGNKGIASQAAPCLIHVHNRGTATLHNVRVICSFPHEMRLVRASSGGRLYKDAVQWLIASLEPNETKDVSLALTAPSPGLRDIVVSARGDKGLEQRQRFSIAFEGTPALNWRTEGTPVAAPGQEIVYKITVQNPGSAPAKDVKIVADLPDNVEFRKASPDFQRGQGAVFFNPVEIPAKQSLTLTITTVAKKAGEARFQFEMNAEGLSAGPLKHTKSTTISPAANPPKEPDPSRIGSTPTPEPKKEPRKVVPAGGVTPIEPVTAPMVVTPPGVEPKKSSPPPPPLIDPFIAPPATEDKKDEPKKNGMPVNEPPPIIIPDDKKPEPK